MTMINTIDLGITLNKPQQDLVKNMKRFNIFECHRGAGKTFLAMLIVIIQATASTRKMPMYAFVSPELAQSERTILTMFIDLVAKIPGSKYNKSKQTFEFEHNGAKIVLFPGSSTNKFRGGRWDGIVLDEFASYRNSEEFWNSGVLPTLNRWSEPDRQGWAIILTTPPEPTLERNFYLELYDKAKESDLWYVVGWNIMESGVFTEEEIKVFEETMGKRAFATEMMLDREPPTTDAFFADCIYLAEEQERIGTFPHKPAFKVFASFDIGLDGTCVWFSQIIEGKYYLIDYLQDINTQKPFSYYINVLKSKPYIYQNIFVPHDAVKNNSSGTVSTHKQLVAAYGNVVTLLPRTLNKLDCIDRAKSAFYKCYFNRPTTLDGIRALKAYAPKRDIDGNIQGIPRNRWFLHGADAFRYMIQGLERSRGSDIRDVSTFRNIENPSAFDDNW